MAASKPTKVSSGKRTVFGSRLAALLLAVSVLAFFLVDNFLLLKNKNVLLPSSSSLSSSSTSSSSSNLTLSITRTDSDPTDGDVHAQNIADIGQEAGASTTKSEITVKKDCKTLRGTSGTWVQDWDIANQTHYRINKIYGGWNLAELDFVATPDEPFRKATSYKWQDDSSCKLEIMTLASFCDTAYRLSVRRILIVGDSLSIQFGHSLLGLLSHPSSRGAFQGSLRPFGVKCPAAGTTAEKSGNSSTGGNEITKSRPAFGVTLWMWRRSPVSDAIQMCDLALGNSSSKEEARYRSFVTDQPDKTLIVFNTGAWIRNGLSEYKKAFYCMVDWIDSLPPEKALSVFRPTNRPNFDCLPPGTHGENRTTQKQAALQTPNTNLREYQQVAQEATRNDTIVPYNPVAWKTQEGVAFGKNWEFIESYNDYSQEYLAKRMERQQQQSNTNTMSSTSMSSSLPMYFLNVYPSTALRRDGHIGENGDCLHYFLPGPLDWWGHFLLSLLVDVAKEQKQP